MGVSFDRTVDAALVAPLPSLHRRFDLHPEYFIDSGAATGSISWSSHSVRGLCHFESIFIVFNNGMDDELFEETVEWAEANIVPVQVHGCFSVASASVVATVAAD